MHHLSIGLKMLSIGLKMLNIWPKTLSIRLQTLSIRPRHIWCPNKDPKNLARHINEKATYHSGMDKMLNVVSSAGRYDG